MQENAAKLLVALYAEAHGKRPQLAHVNTRLKLEEQQFGRAVNALYVAGLISGVSVSFGDDDEHPMQVAVEDILLTRKGRKYVEKLLNIGAKSSHIGKLQKVVEVALARNWTEVVGMAATALADHTQG